MQHLLDLNRLLVKMSDVLLIGLDFILNTTKYTNVQTKKKSQKVKLELFQINRCLKSIRKMIEEQLKISGFTSVPSW